MIANQSIYTFEGSGYTTNLETMLKYITGLKETDFTKIYPNKEDINTTSNPTIDAKIKQLVEK